MIKKLRLVFLLVVISPALAACGLFKSSKFGKTYNQIYSENSANQSQTNGDGNAEDGTDNSTEENAQTTEMLLSVKALPACHSGELDLIQIGMHCDLDKVVLITIKDANGERVIAKFTLDEKLSAEDLRQKLAIAQRVELVGDVGEVFMCIDGTGDGSCGDEAVEDLNRQAEDIVGFVGAPIVVNMEQNGPGGAAEIICDGHQIKEVLAELADGQLLFHQYIRLSYDDKDEARVETAKDVAEMLNNLDDDPRADVLNEEWQLELRDIPGANNLPPMGYRSEIVIPLAFYDAQTCHSVGVRTDGCFAKGTLLSISKTESIAVENLRQGHKVLMSNGQYATILRTVAGPEKEPIITLTTNSGAKLTVTSKHPMLTQAGIKTAREISMGDQLVLANGNRVAVKSIEQSKYEDQVYNFELAGGNSADKHLVIANGLVTGDLYIQEQLTTQNNSQPGVLANLLSIFSSAKK